MKIKQRPTQKQTIPLERFYWNDPKKASNPSFMNSSYKRKGIMASASKIEEIEREFDHLFILTKKREGCYYSNITVDFSAKEKENDQENLTLPIFNKDYKFFTPGFIMNEERFYYDERYAIEDQENFNDKKKMYEAEANDKSSTEFNLRQPRSKYCYVCKKLYEGPYFDHITDNIHSERLERSMGQKYIEETLKQFSERTGKKKRKKQKSWKEKQPRKVKQIQKEICDKGERVATRSKKNYSGEDQTNYTARIRRK